MSAPAPGFPEARGIIAGFREALRQAPPPRLVVLSSVGSQRSSGLGNITSTHLLEEALDNLPFPTALIQAGSFLENYTFALEAAASSDAEHVRTVGVIRPVLMMLRELSGSSGP